MMKKTTWHYLKTWQLAFPVMLSQLGQVLVGTADSIMVGQIGTIPLAASTLANSIFIVVMIFGIGTSFSISPLVANADGEKNQKQISRILKNGLLISTILGILLELLLLVPVFNLHWFNQHPDVEQTAFPYFFVINLSLLPVLWFFSLKQFAEGLSSTKPAMYLTLGSNVLNIGLNYLLIYGKLGFPELGLFGAGLATFISRLFMAFGMFTLMIKHKQFSVYWKAIDWKIIEITLVKKMLNIGLPSGLQMVFEVGAFAFSAVMTGWISPESQAAHNIAINLASISYMIASGISSATTVRVGNQLGRKDFKNLRTAGFVSIKLTVLIMIFFGLLFAFGNTFWPAFYIDEPQVISMAAQLLLIATMFQLSDGIQVTSLGALRGLHDVKIPTFLVAIAYWIIGIPIGYLLGIHWHWGVDGIWYGLALGLTFSATFLLIRFHLNTKKLNREYPSTIK